MTSSLVRSRRQGAFATRPTLVSLVSLRTWACLGAWASLGVWAADVSAATIGPPLLDITRQCSGIAGRNVAAMSECIVAESEARAEILQKWTKISDTSADRCGKLARKTRKYAYAAMAKCLAAEPMGSRPAKAAGGK